MLKPFKFWQKWIAIFPSFDLDDGIYTIKILELEHHHFLQVGMQNSSLGVVLATSHFTSPLVALPSAMSAVVMNIMGSSLGFFWRHVDPSDPKDSRKVDEEWSQSNIWRAKARLISKSWFKLHNNLNLLDCDFCANLRRHIKQQNLESQLLLANVEDLCFYWAPDYLWSAGLVETVLN